MVLKFIQAKLLPWFDSNRALAFSKPLNMLLPSANPALHQKQLIFVPPLMAGILETLFLVE